MTMKKNTTQTQLHQVRFGFGQKNANQTIKKIYLNWALRPVRRKIQITLNTKHNIFH